MGGGRSCSDLQNMNWQFNDQVIVLKNKFTGSSSQISIFWFSESFDTNLNICFFD